MSVLELEGLENLTEIGRGGFGVVYRATETDLSRTVAVKVLLNQGPAEQIQRRLDRERRAMGVLSGHPNIVTIHRTGTTPDGSPYLVMEYLGGGSLADRLRNGGPVPWPRVVELGVLLCDAVETAHQAGVLHRDIKPANILLSDNGVPKLGDFGIANVEAVSQTSGVMKATVAHAPPEVLAGEEPDARSDVYSLASTLYELLSGAPAFVRPTDTSPVPVMMRISTEPPPALDPSIAPATLDRVLRQAMAKDRNDRPASPAHMAQQLHLTERDLASPTMAAPTPPLASAPTQLAQPPAPPQQQHHHPPTPTPTPTPTPEPVAAYAQQPIDQRSQSPSDPPWTPQAPVPAPKSERFPLWIGLGVVAALVLIVGAVVAIGALGGDDGEGDDVAQPDSQGLLGDTEDPAAAATDEAADQADTGTDDSAADQADDPDAGSGESLNDVVDEAVDSLNDDVNEALDEINEDLGGLNLTDTSTAAARTQALEQLVAGNLDRSTVADYDAYDFFADGRGGITVSLPVAWAEQIDATDIGPAIQAGTNISATRAGQPESAVGIYLYPKAQLNFSTIDELLVEIVRVNDQSCAQGSPTAFDHPLFAGNYRILSNCDGADPQSMSIQMVGELKADTTFFFQVSIVTPNVEDVGAAAEILETVEVHLNRL